jgi:hypothetical protein
MKLGIPAVLIAIALTGCGDKAPPPAAPAKPAAAPAAPTTTASNLPAECEAYFKTVTACVEKVGGSNPAVATFKQQMETSKAEWAKVPDKTTLAPVCKQMDDTFKATSAPAMKC